MATKSTKSTHLLTSNLHNSTSANAQNVHNFDETSLALALLMRTDASNHHDSRIQM